MSIDLNVGLRNLGELRGFQGGPEYEGGHKVREMTLVQRHLEGQATGEAVATPAGPRM